MAVCAPVVEGDPSYLRGVGRLLSNLFAASVPIRHAQGLGVLTIRSQAPIRA